MSIAARSRYFDDVVADAADHTAGQALASLSGALELATPQGNRKVVVVAAPAGAGKSYFVVSAAEMACASAPGRGGVVAIACPTNGQAHDLVAALSVRLATTIAFVPASGRNLPPSIASRSNVVEVKAGDCHNHPIVVATLAKFADAVARGDITHRFGYLLIDEAYQARSADYFSVADLSHRHLLVGDSGQLDPFTTMENGDVYRGLHEDPIQSAVAVVTRRYPAAPIFRLPISRRLPPSAIPIASAFYPGHAFEAWTRPDARAMRLAPARPGSPLDDALDLAATSGWSYVRLPSTPVLTSDPASIAVIRDLVVRARDRGAEVSSERTDGRWVDLGPGRIAVAVSHRDQRNHLRAALDDAGLDQVVVDTANRLQGLEFDLTVAWHPLAGLPESDGFHLDPGRLCVMLTRHRHACVVVGRQSDRELLDSLPPSSDAWMGTDDRPEVNGWFAHRQVFDELDRFAVDL